MLKDGPYRSQNRVSITFPTGCWDFHLFLKGDIRHFILYSMSALWLVVDSHFVIIDNTTQKVVTSLMITDATGNETYPKLCFCCSVSCFGTHLAQTL
jgi:hypothetical protein